MVKIVRVCAPQGGKCSDEKSNSYEELCREWRMPYTSELVHSLTDFNGHASRSIKVVEGVHSGLSVGEQCQKNMLLPQCCISCKYMVQNGE